MEFKNIKNVPYGKADFPIEEDIEHNGRNNDFGIYGPNGSGKTALINMLSILRCVVLGINPNSLSLAKYINNLNNEAFISCSFIYFNSKNPLTFKYELKLKKEVLNNIDKINILSENISYLGSREKKEQKRFLSVDFVSKNKSITPSKYYESFFDDKNAYESFYASKFNSSTFIFSKYMISHLKKHLEFNKYVEALSEFQKFMMVNLFIVDQSHNNDVFLNINYRNVQKQSVSQINSSFINYRITLPISEYDAYEHSLIAANTLLEALIKEVTIEINQETIIETLLEDGKKGISFELVSKRGDSVLPLSLESNGIKSLFAIASLLVNAFNDESITIAIDEFDSGVFEYLLGSILEIYKESGKGLFIFNSHNLRPLEVLGKNNIYFTSGVGENVYTKFPYIQPGSNFRNQYLRSLFLSDDRCFEYKAKKSEIRKGFLKAMKV